ncbi:MAG: hypothetical protein IT324_21995 [Anaerolineae bacterium]|nr:hypothetical protein [Anaerolineae bacterium]
MSDTDPKWSLPDELKKRKTQDLARQIEIRSGGTAPLRLPDQQPPAKPQTGPLNHPTLKPLDPNTARTMPSSKRETQTLRAALSDPSRIPAPPAEPVLKPLPRNAAPTIPASARTSQMLAVVTGDVPERWSRKQKRTAGIALALILGVCLFTSILASRSTAIRQQTFKPLPTAYTASVVAYLKAMRMPFADFRTFAVPDAMWKAREMVQFEILHDGHRGTFLVMSYDTIAQAGADAFRASFDRKYGTWKLIQINNVLLLAAPRSSEMLTSEIASHLNQFLIAPYRSFIPTSTPGGLKFSELNIR